MSTVLRHLMCMQVDIEAEVDGWLHCVNRYGIRGLVPSSYVRILGANEGPTDVASQLFGGYGASSVTPQPLESYFLLTHSASHFEGGPKTP